MTSIDVKKKKFKGKKKVKNVLEKKAKGLKLNKIDRKKIVKIEAQNELKKKVASELQKMKLSMSKERFLKDDDTKESVCTESSFGSQPAPRRPKKKVSFSGKLEHTKLFDHSVELEVVRPSGATPGKSILRTPDSKKKRLLTLAKKNKKEDIKEEQPQKKKKKIVRIKAEDGEENPDENEGADGENDDEVDSTPKKPSEKARFKKPIMVSKSVKEKLLTMPRKERKAFLRQLRITKKPILELSDKCKQLWEKVRSSKTPTAEKDECIHKLVGLVKGNATKLIYAHDTSRVIETLVATERPGIVNMLFEELTPVLVRMSKMSYSKFFVLKMLKNGTKEQKEIIVNAFRGHAVKLFRNVNSARVLETAFNEVANAQQRYDIISEFYGKEFVIFRTDKPRSLKEIIAEEPGKKNIILQHLEEEIDAIVGKGIVEYSLAHRLMLDLVENADEEKKLNLLDSLVDKIPHLVHTMDGARLAVHMVWCAPVKNRKMIVKNFKDLTVKAAVDRYGHRVLFAIFDTVDDTVLVNKCIVSELGNEMKKLVEDEWGEKVIHYLFHPRDARGADRMEIEYLAKGDSNPHSKKVAKDRYAQLYEAITESLYSYVAANMGELVFEKNRVKFVAASLETTSQYDLFDRKVPAEYRISCNKAIAELANKEFIPMDQEGFHLIEHQHGSFLLNAVLRCDKNLPEAERLSTAIVSELSEESLGSWIACNKGCHVLAKMLEVGSPEVVEKLTAAINRRQLNTYATKGAAVLRGKLDEQK